MKTLLQFLIVSAVMASCMTARNLPKHNDRFPQAAAEYCAQKFPDRDSISVRDSVHFDTLYLETLPETIRDTFYLKGDTVVRQVIKQCPPVKSITKTQIKETYVLRIDSAAHAALRLAAAKEQLGRQAAETERDEIKGSRKEWRTRALVTWGTIILLLAAFIAGRLKRRKK